MDRSLYLSDGLMKSSSIRSMYVVFLRSAKRSEFTMADASSWFNCSIGYSHERGLYSWCIAEKRIGVHCWK